MRIEGQILILLICLLLSFVFIRGFLYGIKRYQLNKSAFKKRKRGETVKEWLFYSRYREEIPKVLIVLYYCVLFAHIAGLIVCVALYMLALPQGVGGMITKIIAAFDVAWIVILAVLFWSPGRDYAYERWIIKKRGQRRDKK